MKTLSPTNQNRAMTLLEILVVCAVLAILAVILLPQFMSRYSMSRTRAERIQCVNNLKIIGLSYRVWPSDPAGTFPMHMSATNGGTMEFNTGPNVWRHFQIISNELNTPKILVCPADTRAAASNFVFLSNSNISFFLGIDVTNDWSPQMILSGDRNITNGTPVRNGILELTTNQPAGWTAEMHGKVGNIAMADGSVQQLRMTRPDLYVWTLPGIISNTGLATNRLQMPILAP